MAVVDGEMMMASQSPASTNAWMSEICLLSSSAASETRNSLMTPSDFSTSTCCCIVMKPVTRHGLDTEALEKHRVCAPVLANSVVSVISGSIAWSHGVAESPSGSTSRWASCRS